MCLGSFVLGPIFPLGGPGSPSSCLCGVGWAHPIYLFAAWVYMQTQGMSRSWLGFLASASDVRRSTVPLPHRLLPLPPPPDLLRSFAEVVAIEHSRGSSSERNSNSKHSIDGSGDTGADPWLTR